MSEKENEVKKWTQWSVVSTNGGPLRLKRTNVEDGLDAEYREVPEPVFTKDELIAMVDFGQSGLLPPNDIVHSVYDRRYRTLAFRLCSELNTNAPQGGGK